MVTSLLHRVYLLGYTGYCPARLIRCVAAGSVLHRAWLAGYMGIYSDAYGRRSGVCDREGLRFR